MALTKQVLKYTLLPGLWPRMLDLFRSGFSYVAYYIAIIFQAAGLLEAAHPYVNPANFGQFGVRHVMTQGYSNLVFEWSRADQILLYFTILAGLILLLVQGVLIVLAIVASTSAMAYGINPFTDIFSVPSGITPHGPANDMALMTLDRVFGVQGIFDSCISTSVPCQTWRGEAITAPAAYPFPMHLALHKLFEFYSLGILLVSVIVILYFVVTIVGETITTGSPFGQRYNAAWAPIRLILFFALLIPTNLGGTNAGLNMAQIGTLWTAKLGSNMATNGWMKFNDVLTGTYLGEKESLIANPKIPEIGDLTRFLFIVKTCELITEQQGGSDTSSAKNIEPYIVTPQTLVSPGSVDDFLNTSYETAAKKSKNGNIILRFGEKNEDKYNDGVSQECGEIVFQVVDAEQPAALALQIGYYKLVLTLWQNTILENQADCLRKKIATGNPDTICLEWPPKKDSITPDIEAKLKTDLKDYIQAQKDSGDFSVPADLQKAGWAGAAIWYNRIAEMNGALVTASFNVPNINKWPRVMEEVSQQRRTNTAEAVAGNDRFNPQLNGGQVAEFTGGTVDHPNAKVLYVGYMSWSQGILAKPDTPKSNNAILNTINLIFGSAGLFEMRENTDIHPLAQLSALGKGLVEATVRNVMIGGAGAIGGQVLDGFFGSLVTTGSAFLFTVALNMMTIGIILYYVLPFLPFIYFFFAVSGWVKSIFEAMVAMPLWALAHIRIDGPGLSGPGASQGYFLILEILLRPILIIFGLLAGISVFAAMIKLLNEVFDLVVLNTAGFDATGTTDATDMAFYRGPLDGFMFTLIYGAIAYMIGNSCFKLIDMIPNQILRYIGSTTSTFQENAGDPASQLTQQVYRGGTIFTQQAQNSLSGGKLAALIG